MKTIEEVMVSQSPLVSVCIPTFNAEKYIRETIDSVLNQSYQNLEVIILDDCSTDRTLEIAESIGDPRITIHKNSRNMGPIESWSKLLDYAGGDYLKLLCHDDVLYQDCISSQVAVLVEKRNVVLVASNRNIIDEGGSIVCSPRRFKQNKYIDGRSLLIASLRKGTNIIGEPHAVMVRLEVVRQEGIKFGGSFYLIDLDFYSKVLMHGDAYVINRVLSAFRISRDSASYRLSLSQAKSFIDFSARMKKMSDLRMTFLDSCLIGIMAVVNQCIRMGFYKIKL